MARSILDVEADTIMETALVTPPPVNTFCLGDRVTWMSQSNGTIRIKTGTIVGAVPAGMSFHRFLSTQNALSQYDCAPIDGTFGRKDISYLVAVSVQTRAGTLRKRQRLYWPRVKTLRLQGRDDTCPPKAGQGGCRL